MTDRIVGLGLVDRRARHPLRGPTRRRIHVLLGVLGICVALALMLRLTRDPEAHFSIAADASAPLAAGDPRFQELLELFGRIRIQPGNTAQQLLNGDGTYPLLWRDLASARQSITIQSYFAAPGSVSDTLARILSERARAGVTVLVLLDAFGALDIKKGWYDALRQSGVQVLRLRPLKWFSVHSAANRSHVRAMVIDGRTGYTGGFGFADYWLGDGHHDKQWRETNVRFQGPLVASLQAAFAAAWAEASGTLLSGRAFFPADTGTRTAAGVRAGLLYAEPGIGSSSAERVLGLLIAGATRRLYITNSYFVPNEAFRLLLVAAAARGADVRVITAGSKTDVRTSWLAGRYYYGDLLAHGIRIYEYQPTMMHAKTVTVDGVLGTIGSLNFTNRSLAFNNESNLVVLDTGFAHQMEVAFVDDLRYSREITTADVRRRRWWERLLEMGAAALSRLI